MLALFLLSNMGITVNKHYCGKTLESVSFFVSKDSCCGDIEMPEGCCLNETDYIKLDINVDPPVVASAVSLKHNFTSLTFFAESFLYFPAQVNTPDYLNYKPPLLDVDILALIESILI